MILVVSLILAWIIIPLIFILPVGAALTYEFIFERIFRKLIVGGSAYGLRQISARGTDHSSADSERFL